MKVSWTEAKRAETLRRRGVDLARAARIFLGDVLEAEDRRSNYSERRYRALGEHEGIAYVVVFTWREDVRHLVTAWKVDEAGRRRYARLLAGGP